MTFGIYNNLPLQNSALYVAMNSYLRCNDSIHFTVLVCLLFALTLQLESSVQTYYYTMYVEYLNSVFVYDVWIVESLPLKNAMGFRFACACVRTENLQAY